MRSGNVRIMLVLAECASSESLGKIGGAPAVTCLAASGLSNSDCDWRASDTSVGTMQ